MDSHTSPWDLHSDEDSQPCGIIGEMPTKTSSGVVNKERPEEERKKHALPDHMPKLTHPQSWVDVLKVLFQSQLILLQAREPLSISTACSGTGCPVLGMTVPREQAKRKDHKKETSFLSSLLRRAN